MVEVLTVPTGYEARESIPAPGQATDVTRPQFTKARAHISSAFALAFLVLPWCHEFEPLLRGWVVRQAEIGVQLGMGRLPYSKHLDGQASFVEYVAEPSRLRRCMRVSRDMQGQER